MILISWLGHIGRFDFSSGLCLDKALCINFFTCKTVLGFGTNVRAKEKSGFYKLLKDTCGLWHYVHAWAEPRLEKAPWCPLGPQEASVLVPGGIGAPGTGHLTFRMLTKPLLGSSQPQRLNLEPVPKWWSLKWGELPLQVPCRSLSSTEPKPTCPSGCLSRGCLPGSRHMH